MPVYVSGRVAKAVVWKPLISDCEIVGSNPVVGTIGIGVYPRKKFQWFPMPKYCVFIHSIQITRFVCHLLQTGGALYSRIGKFRSQALGVITCAVPFKIQVSIISMLFQYVPCNVIMVMLRWIKLELRISAVKTFLLMRIITPTASEYTISVL